MPHILVHILPNSAYFAPKRPAYFKKNFRYKPVSLECDRQTDCAVKKCVATGGKCFH